MLYDPENIGAERLLVIGLGKEKDFDLSALNKVSEKIASTLKDANPIEAVVNIDMGSDKSTCYQRIKNMVLAMEASTYRSDSCKSKQDKPKRPLKRVAFVINDRRLVRTANKAISHGQAIAKGMNLTKSLADLPGNICTPTYLAGEARKLGRTSTQLKVNVLDEKAMEKLGMGALLSVSKGSREPAKLITMNYQGGPSSQKPVVLVGKGLTFDAGGISIKPSASMDEMKYDMCGGATVMGVISACVEMQLPINVIGVIPSSENLPDGAANKPGDIVTSMSGQTIEVLNTDAEGRLILCDALTYSERYKPAIVIDIATLTGACIIALGHQTTGLMANNDELANQLIQAGDDMEDKAWRLPIWDSYQKQLDSNFADIANIGGRPAGTITAACFLSRFTEKFKWAHLDIAGTAWRSGSNKGATGRPVPLLTQYLLNRCKLSD